MNARIRKLLLWFWPCIQRVYARFELQANVQDLRVRGEEHFSVSTIPVPGGHLHATSHTRTSGHSVPGAHVWIILALLLLATTAMAQQGGQTSSAPPLTGTGAPTGNCGVGSMYVNTTTGDLYDCNGGSWNKVNGGGGSGAFSGGLGSSFQDAAEIAAPSNPASGNDRLWLDSTSHLLACHTSSGANCMPSGGAGTVTQVTSGNFSPLFNVSVANQTSTPAFSFSTLNQSANTIYGNCTGSTGAPAFCAITAAMLPFSLPLSVGNGGTSLSALTAHELYVGNGTSAPNPVSPGNAGQMLESNGAGADPTFQDPIVSYAYINLFNAVSATGMQTSSVTRDSTFGQYGTLIVTWASITGSPSGCTIQIKSADSQGNVVNNGSAVSVTPANGTSGIAFTPAATLQTASQMQAVYACTGYPSGGTLTLDFAPAISAAVINTPSVSGSGNFTVVQPTGSNLHIAVDSLPSNVSVNLAQVNGSATATSGTGIAEVGIVGHAGASVDGATGGAPPADVIYVGGLGSGATGGDLIGLPVGDTYKAINISTATTTLIVTGVSGRQVRISSQHMIAAAADNVAWIEGTGATCGTGTAGMAGGTTAASGYNFAANGGIAEGSGVGTVLQTVTAGDSVCLVTSAAVQLSGGIEYTIF